MRKLPIRGPHIYITKWQESYYKDANEEDPQSVETAMILKLGLASEVVVGLKVLKPGVVGIVHGCRDKKKIQLASFRPKPQPFDRAQMVVSINWGVLFVGVLVIRALLLGVYVGVLDFG